MIYDKIIVAGFGGQGALRIGQMLAYAAVNEGLDAEWMPSYGAEMRGGTANCSVSISDHGITYQLFTDPDVCIIMNNASLAKFGGMTKPQGILILNSDIATDPVTRDDLHIYRVPSDAISEKSGNKKGSNMVLLGAYIAVKGGVELESIYEIIRHSFTGAKAKYVESNIALVKAGYDYIKGNYHGEDL